MSASSPIFSEHVALIDWWCDHFRDVADRVEQHLLNVQGKPTARRRDRPFFARALETCVYDVPGLPALFARLRGVLTARQAADGFEAARLDRFANEFDPLELVVRAYEHWDQHRWPGRSGRESFARVVTATFLFKELERLSLRMWDDGEGVAHASLAEVQRLLERVNQAAEPFVMLRDARWLLQTAQSPLTPHLEPYFRVAAQIADTWPLDERLGVHAASVKMTGGHLRSQWRYGIWNAGKPPDDPELLAFLRNSNAMDYASLVQDLVPLFDAYDQALAGGRDDARLRVADAILQGLSADPEIFVTRLDLLGPYTMVEDVFVTDGDDVLERTPFGRRHHYLLTRYRELVVRLAGPLTADAAQFDPALASYSPFGIVYGFSVDILSNIATARLVGQPDRGLSFEDTFVSSGNLEEKRERAADWARLPVRPGERAHFEYAPDFAAMSFLRLREALDRRIDAADRWNASGHPDARVFVSASSATSGANARLTRATRAQEYCFTTNPALAEAVGAVAWPKAELARDRREGGFLASATVDGHLFGISKLPLTLSVAQGSDVLIADVPRAVIDRLALTAGEIVDEVRQT